MKNRMFAIILLTAMLFVMIGCSGEEAPTEAFSGDSDSEANASESGEAEESSSTPSQSEGNKVELEPEGEDPEAGNRLIYFEDFEKYSSSLGSEALLSAMNWSSQSVSDGAYSTDTVKYGISKQEGNSRLYLENNKTDGKDSYVTLLSNEAMGRFNAKNYTYQFDLEYSDGANAARYIAIVSSYDGWFYNSFHLRVSGKGNNQCHHSNNWFTYDAEGDSYAASTDKNSIINKILNKDFVDGEAALKDISLSIRYVVDWQKGNSVYIRVNDEGYVGSGKWTLVSKASAEGNGNGLFKPELGGAALVLKVGGKQNGYIDNITVWEGTGEEPSDKQNPLLTSASGCTRHTYEGVGTCRSPKKCIYCGYLRPTNANHIFKEISGTDDARCSNCSVYKSSTDGKQPLEKLPLYEGGEAADRVYLSGHGLNDASFSDSKEALTQVISNTSTSQFDNYCKKLAKYGFSKGFSRTVDGNKYAEFTKDKELVYVYFTEACKEVRIIYDTTDSSTTVGDFGYSYTKKTNDSTELYQYGLSMSSTGMGINNPNNTERRIDCGMLYILKLADNSVMIIDGGGYQQMDNAEADKLMAFLREITGQSTGKIKVAAWYISHSHVDHIAGLALFIKKHSASLDFDRIMFNFPSMNSEQPVVKSGGQSAYTKLIKYFSDYIKDDGVKYIKLHTGQQISLADITVDVIYTHEDAVNPYGGWGELENDFNNSSSVIKITFDQKSFMVLGDINIPAADIILANNSDSVLKSDIVQMAHHVINNVSDLYHKIKAPVVLVPQSKAGADRGDTRKAAHAAAKTYVENDMIYYAGEETVGLAVQGGALKEIYSAPASTLQYGSWSW